MRAVLTNPGQRFAVRPGARHLGGFKEDVRIVESDEDKPGVILDYDEGGHLVSLEVLDASTRVTDTRHVDFQLTE